MVCLRYAVSLFSGGERPLQVTSEAVADSPPDVSLFSGGERPLQGSPRGSLPVPIHLSHSSLAVSGHCKQAMKLVSLPYFSVSLFSGGERPLQGLFVLIVPI